MGYSVNREFFDVYILGCLDVNKLQGHSLGLESPLCILPAFSFNWSFARFTRYIVGSQLLIEWSVSRKINLTLKLAVGLVDSGIKYAGNNHSDYLDQPFEPKSLLRLD